MGPPWGGRRPSGIETMTSQGTARGRFQRAIHAPHVQNAEMAAREMGGLSLADALTANADPARYERAAFAVLQRFIGERLLPALCGGAQQHRRFPNPAAAEASSPSGPPAPEDAAGRVGGTCRIRRRRR